MDAIFGVLLGLNPAGSGGGRRQGWGAWGLFFGKNLARAPPKFRARRAPCLWQGAADLKAQAALLPALQHELEAWILVSGTRLDEFGCLLLVLGWS